MLPGLSDFFQLNLREQAIAEAELKRWRAHLDHYGVSMDLEALGLDTSLLPPLLQD